MVVSSGAMWWPVVVPCGGRGGGVVVASGAMWWPVVVQERGKAEKAEHRDESGNGEGKKKIFLSLSDHMVSWVGRLSGLVLVVSIQNGKAERRKGGTPEHRDESGKGEGERKKIFWGAEVWGCNLTNMKSCVTQCEAVLSREAWGSLCILWRKPG